MSNQPQPPQPNDSLGPEFSPDDVLEQSLLEDGAQWRADSVPPIAPFAGRVNAALRERRHTSENGAGSAQRPREERPMAHRRVILPPQAASPPGQRPPGAWSTLVAVAVAVAVVATLAGVFHALSNTRVAAPAATPTPNFATHVTRARGHWADVVQYMVGTNSAIYVEPSDTRIAFRTSTSPTDATAVTLARTSDGGATWTTLSLPTDDGGWFGGLALSPLDAQTVFLSMGADQSDPHCPASALGYGTGYVTQPIPNAGGPLDLQYPTSGGYSCSFQYVSRDGGAHWSHPSFPWPAQHFADLGVETSGFPGEVQGTTLFAAVTGNLNGEYFDGVRLVASEDGGSTWSAVDNTIYAAGQVVTSYTAIPGMTSLYAMSVPQQTPAGQESHALLWSSEDQGVHWTRVGPAPLALAQLIGTIRSPGGPILYAVGLQSSGPEGQVPTVASHDGGRTWVAASNAGWPQGQVANPWSLNTLADGSLLMEFLNPLPPGASSTAYDPNTSFYGWRPGDSQWFPVTPRPGGGSEHQVWLTSPATSPQTLWIVSASQQDTTYTVRQCVLQ